MLSASPSDAHSPGASVQQPFRNTCLVLVPVIEKFGMSAEGRTAGSMRRYFFHLRCGSQVIRDDHGDELADDHVARERAVEAAKALLQSDPDQVATWRDCVFEVTDPDGQAIWRMPVLDAIDGGERR